MYRNRSTVVGRGMGGLEGRAVEEQIGLSTVEEPFLFKVSDSDRELAMKRDCSRRTWWLFATVWLWVGTSCAQTAFQAALKTIIAEGEGGRCTEGGCEPGKAEPHYTWSCQRGTWHRLSSRKDPLRE